ncbi:MAG: hypothetical protein ABF932_12095 [Gluconobacter potus]|uniref:Uncharacterized protein n=1 Tax=Gluconobacter potus TaxID=2724927 RepID=A0ABR9YLQ6_9PROT|nr:MULTISPECIES: hypothetical protein [Gluconobacter]MBF0865445.1 hypothetical protein [Gluconobacter sp. R71656]MBF0866723.1 hypothetical protein [Gluconobacter sp. R75628]MBF0873401.1 hypothetical protein [Gluconobacter sp. R75629]MBF0882398.1 hypothetical protein [Gluconobacter potus]
MTAHISVFGEHSRLTGRGREKQNLLPHAPDSPEILPRMPPFFISAANSHETTVADRDKYSEDDSVQAPFPVIFSCTKSKLFRNITPREKCFYQSAPIRGKIFTKQDTQ